LSERLVCGAAVIAFSELMALDSGHRKWALSLYDSGRYMRLDAAAQRALNVLKQRTDANDTFSLYGLMNRGRTTMAKRLLKVLSV
jgi:DNA mismatch repair protein MSH2